ncbi:IclR family transcriptional regulator [Geodermatophilus sp. TF02-6]|uniref:IclR family transcriptional regulator n=1 Tax=Geodermatophilus sp. TF02-6 TaxID=2250575 RepID=UPI000DE84E2F|nr:IclR family transcriptional regulator [Geodermatophilus sp. TF02-6]RBY76833.1 IclR family transcriptional regulator [Geodermatophilus sp. TF02-6]
MGQGADTSGASFLRGLSVLITVAESGEARADSIATELGIPLSTVYRYLRTLRELDLVEERDRSYVPGWRLLELAGLDATRTRLVELGHSVLREISQATGETAVLTVRAGTRALCLRQVESHHPMRMAFRLGQLLPLYAGAGQRMLLAYAPAAVVQRVFEQPQWQTTDRTLPPAAILRELEQIRRSGYLVTHGELSEGAVAVAIPVFAGGEVVCSLTVAGPEIRCGPAWLSQARASLAAAGRRLAEVLDDPGCDSSTRGRPPA